MHGFLGVDIRLPADVLSDQIFGDQDKSPIGASDALKWFQSARAGFLTVHETLQPMAGFDARLDDFQLHEIIVERVAAKVSSFC